MSTPHHIHGFFSGTLVDMVAGSEHRLEWSLSLSSHAEPSAFGSVTVDGGTQTLLVGKWNSSVNSIELSTRVTWASGDEGAQTPVRHFKARLCRSEEGGEVVVLGG